MRCGKHGELEFDSLVLGWYCKKCLEKRQLVFLFGAFPGGEWRESSEYCPVCGDFLQKHRFLPVYFCYRCLSLFCPLDFDRNKLLKELFGRGNKESSGDLLEVPQV